MIKSSIRDIIHKLVKLQIKKFNQKHAKTKDTNETSSCENKRDQ